MVKANNSNSDNILEFVSEISSISKYTKVDLVFTSSSLQYTNNPEYIINDLVCLDPQIFFLTKTAFSTDNKVKVKTEYSKLSGNGPIVNISAERRPDLISYVAYIWPKFMLDRILSVNYELIFEINEGIPNGYRLTDHVNLFGMCWKKLR